MFESCRVLTRLAFRSGLLALCFGLVSCDLFTGPPRFGVQCSDPDVRRVAGPTEPILEAVRFPIVAWHGVPTDRLTAAEFDRLANAGFTVNYTSRASAELNEEILDLAAASGVLAIIDDVSLRADSPFDARAVRRAVARYSGHPGLFGYQLREEPPATLFQQMGMYADTIRKLDPDPLLYSNINPDYAGGEALGAARYEDYLNGYIEAVRPRVISVAYYPLNQHGFRRGYFEFMERLRAAAYRDGAEFWGFAMTAHIEPFYPPPRESWIRFQVYSALAHGARGIEYFPYSLPRSPSEDFRVAILDSAGTPTHLYEIVDRLNQELWSLAPVLRSLRSVRVCRSEAPLRSDRVDWDLEHVRRSTGLPAVLGEFADEYGDPHVMLVSLDLEADGVIDLELSSAVEALEEVPKQVDSAPRRVAATNNRVTVRLGAGDGALFRVIVP